MITEWTFKMGPATQLNGTQPLRRIKLDMNKLKNPGAEGQTQPCSTSTRFQAAVAETEDGQGYQRPACPLPRVWGKYLRVSRAPAPGSICVPWRGSSFQLALAEWPCIPLPTNRFVCHASRFLRPSRSLPPSSLTKCPAVISMGCPAQE